MASKNYAKARDYELLPTYQGYNASYGDPQAFNTSYRDSQASNTSYSYSSPEIPKPSYGSPHIQQAGSRPRRSLLNFSRRNPGMLSALSLGTSGAFACFGFTYWLSQQRFSCPAWTMDCNVGDNVHTFVTHLGLVQGLLSTVYGICVAMMAYAAYQVAETTLWPALTQQSFTLRDIDRFLNHSRGSLPSFPSAIWHARRLKLVAVLLIVALVSILLHLTSTVVGYAFTVGHVPTTYWSNHTSGGGMGFGFTQTSPPGPMPGEPAMAYVLYSPWSYAQSDEMLPELRSYLLDRTNLSAIGNFSVNAIHVRKTIQCSGFPLQILSYNNEVLGDEYEVATHMSDNVESYDNPDAAVLRFQPGQTSVWVDSFRNLSNSRAVTKLVFGMLNGTIEGGVETKLTYNMSQACTENYPGVAPCSGISALACDVEIDLVNGHASIGTATHSNATLTSVETMTFDGQSEYLWPISVYLGAVPSTMGPAIWGAQPMFSLGTRLPNSTFALPTAYSDNVSGGGTGHWTQANITNFIDVASGALGIYLAQAWPTGWAAVESILEMPRLDTHRSYWLLAPPAFVLGSVVVLAALSVVMYHSANISEVRLGWTSEILRSSETSDLKGMIHDSRARSDLHTALERTKLRYGISDDGYDGLGKKGNVRAFA